MNKLTTPPYMGKQDKVILFDGVCKLCNKWSQFIIEYDKQHIFKLASVQSNEGKAILRHFNMATETFNTMLYIEGSQAFTKSDAFLRIIQQFPFPFKALALFKYLPKAVKDWGYDRIALNRYALFGKYDQCILPSPDHNKRFLSLDE